MSDRNGKPSQTMTLETFTPDQAKEILEAAEKVRESKPKQANIRPNSLTEAGRLSVDMKAGRWQVNGETVKFNAAGVLIDGQTRMQACVIADVPFKTYVVRGVEDDTNVDMGRKRRISDYLRRAGMKHCSTLAAAVPLMLRLKGVEYDEAREKYILPHGGVHINQIFDAIKKNPGIKASVATVEQSCRKQIGRTSVLSALHFMFAQKDSKLADWFMESLGKGERLGPEEPVFALRRRLLVSKAGRRSASPTASPETDESPRRYGTNSTRRVTDTELMGLTIKAWNLTRAGQTVGNLRFIASGPMRESFPVIE